uniref:Uncharacterized protein n=1 Tax=Trachysalambria curvirostris majanivirus TaxID=2984281 RepID=A0A9C7CFM1_9VIRU|nr:MAG: hypothetical protein [Trachysalambria curvirostris majanivirus]
MASNHLEQGKGPQKEKESRLYINLNNFDDTENPQKKMDSQIYMSSQENTDTELNGPNVEEEWSRYIHKNENNHSAETKVNKSDKEEERKNSDTPKNMINDKLCGESYGMKNMFKGETYNQRHGMDTIQEIFNQIFDTLKRVNNKTKNRDQNKDEKDEQVKVGLPKGEEELTAMFSIYPIINTHQKFVKENEGGFRCPYHMQYPFINGYYDDQYNQHYPYYNSHESTFPYYPYIPYFPSVPPYYYDYLSSQYSDYGDYGNQQNIKREKYPYPSTYTNRGGPQPQFRHRYHQRFYDANRPNNGGVNRDPAQFGPLNYAGPTNNIYGGGNNAFSNSSYDFMMYNDKNNRQSRMYNNKHKNSYNKKREYYRNVL